MGFFNSNTTKTDEKKSFPLGIVDEFLLSLEMVQKIVHPITMSTHLTENWWRPFVLGCILNYTKNKLEAHQAVQQGNPRLTVYSFCQQQVACNIADKVNFLNTL